LPNFSYLVFYLFILAGIGYLMAYLFSNPNSSISCGYNWITPWLLLLASKLKNKVNAVYLFLFYSFLS
jgi:hypothetical protein